MVPAKNHPHHSRRAFLRTTGTVGLGLLAGCTLRNRFDLIITGGTIYDGLGNPPVQKDVGVRNGRISAIGDLRTATADRTIQAAGLVLSPGFIDIHTHTDVELLVNPKAESKIRQGVTTEVSGNCGSSPFPLNPEDSAEMQRRMKEKYGIEYAWSDLEGFFDLFRQKGLAVNYATFTGHGDLRAFVVGKNDVQPTPEQLTEMGRILADTLEQGSLGLSTGLEYAPGSYARTGELIELNKTVSALNGVYATHMRNEDDRVEEAMEEALTICRESGVSLQISHLKACNRANWHKTERLLSTLEEAGKQSPVQADRYPYTAYSTGLSAFLPLWSRQGETEDILARLKSDAEVERIREYTEDRGRRIGGWDRVIISSCNSEANSGCEGKSIRECAREAGKGPFEFIRELLIEEKTRVSIVGFAMEEENLKNVLAHPLVSVGSDGNAVAPYGLLNQGKPHPRFYGTFPRVLGKYVREEKALNLTEAIRKMTSMPAAKLGLRDRGVIAEGKIADLVLFDPDKVQDQATFTNPHQYPLGVESVIVNGALTLDNGRQTGVLNGQILRHNV